MKRITTTVFVLIVLVSGTFSQIVPPAKKVVISGTVMDDPYPMKRMSQPLKEVKIILWEQLAFILDNQTTAIMPPTRSRLAIDSAISDAQGKFAFNSVSVGSYTVSFDNPGYVSRSIALYVARDTAFTIALLAAGAKAKVAGNVTTPCAINMNCIRQPVAGCTVTVTSEVLTISPLATTQAVVYPIKIATISAITGSSGQFSIDSVPLAVNGERIMITFSKSGFTSQSIDTAIWNTGTTSVNASLSPAAVGSRDTVYISPLAPTTRDSLYFTLYNSSRCCGTIYRDNNVTVADTTIMLSYSYDDTLCPFVMCFTAGSQTPFASKAIKAGKYGIYKVESLYCPPGRICPLGLLAPVRVGEITVKTSTSTRPIANNSILKSEGTLSVIGNTASIVLGKDARVSLRAYNLQGALIAEIFNGGASAGTSCFDLKKVLSKTAKGPMLLKLSVHGVADTKLLMR